MTINPLPVGTNTITIRFRAPQTWSSSANDAATVDNVNISFNAPANAVNTEVKRTANLTGATSAWLSFDYSSAGLAAGDTLVVEASSSAGGPFTVLATFTGGVPDVAPTYTLTSFISGTTTIRFQVTGGFNASGQAFNIDNVDIGYIVPPSSTFAAGSPPNFLSGSTGCAIAPDGILTLTYDVTVDNPLTAGIQEITNTAYVNSNEIVLPLSASVTNLVVNPTSGSAEVGDIVWLDTDGDGIRDVGEPGLANLEVILKDQYGTPLMTTTTDATGHYRFTGVTPGNGYYVEATSGTLPSGVQQSAPSGRSDNRTDAFNLSAGQSYTDADLGYKAATGSAIIGDLIWSDFNSNGLRDAGEAGLAGVTVQLWQDTNGSGIFEPTAGDTLLGTATTAADGSYLFTGITASGTEDYFVYVDETQAQLTGFTRTTQSVFTISNVDAGDAILSANYGFSGATTYTISDRVWFDSDGNGSQDAGRERDSPRDCRPAGCKPQCDCDYYDRCQRQISPSPGSQGAALIIQSG